MNEIITTKSIAPGIVDVSEDFILYEQPMSRLIFHAQIHNKGIRGRIIRQRRKSNDDSWIPDQAIDIRTLGKEEFINIELKTAAVGELFDAIIKCMNILVEKGIEYGVHEYAVVDPNTVVVTEENKISYINKILEAGYGEDVWQNLVETDPSLATKLSYARIQDDRKKNVDELELRLQTGGFSETSGSDSWQKWIYKNNWLFGVNYREPIEKEKINISGIMPDYLFPTLDGFVDILEIKLPDNDVIAEDRSHRGSWRWTSETNIAIGQVVNYLGEIDRLRLEIERNINTEYNWEISLLKPRAYVLIGDSASWDAPKKEGLRKLNHALHGIEVLTYKDLYDRGSEATNTGNE